MKLTGNLLSDKIFALLKDAVHRAVVAPIYKNQRRGYRPLGRAILPPYQYLRPVPVPVNNGRPAQR